MTTPENYAAVSNSTVYGVGDSPEAARQDAAEWMTDTESATIILITPEQRRRIVEDQVVELYRLGID